MPSLNTARACCSALVHNNKLYVAGGFSQGTYMRKVEVWDFTNKGWEEINSLNYERADAVLIEFEGKMLGKKEIDISKNKTWLIGWDFRDWSEFIFPHSNVIKWEIKFELITSIF